MNRIMAALGSADGSTMESSPKQQNGQNDKPAMSLLSFISVCKGLKPAVQPAGAINGNRSGQMLTVRERLI